MVSQIIKQPADSLLAAVLNTINKIYDITSDLYEKGVFLYILLILIGFIIYYVLRFFIGIKKGREEKGTVV